MKTRTVIFLAALALALAVLVLALAVMVDRAPMGSVLCATPTHHPWFKSPATPEMGPDQFRQPTHPKGTIPLGPRGSSGNTL